MEKLRPRRLKNLFQVTEQVAGRVGAATWVFVFLVEQLGIPDLCRLPCPSGVWAPGGWRAGFVTRADVFQMCPDLDVARTGLRVPRT